MTSLSLSSFSSHVGQTWLPIPGHQTVAEVRYVTAGFEVVTGRKGDWVTATWSCHGGTLVYTTKAAAEAALAASIEAHNALVARWS